LARETAVLRENLPQYYFVNHKSHMTLVALVGSQQLTKTVDDVNILLLRASVLFYTC
jgi:DNA-binding GntR family transcriptional regulator